MELGQDLVWPVRGHDPLGLSMSSRVVRRGDTRHICKASQQAPRLAEQTTLPRPLERHQLARKVGPRSPDQEQLPCGLDAQDWEDARDEVLLRAAMSAGDGARDDF